MKFLADEGCDGGLVRALRQDGHDVVYAAETLCGFSDEALLSLAWTERRIVLTEDKDFGELVYRLRRPAHGVILPRLKVRDRAMKVPKVQLLLRGESGRLPGSFVVLDRDRIPICALAAPAA